MRFLGIILWKRRPCWSYGRSAQRIAAQCHARMEHGARLALSGTQQGESCESTLQARMRLPVFLLTTTASA